MRRPPQVLWLFAVVLLGELDGELGRWRGAARAEVFTGQINTLQSFQYIMRFCFEPSTFDEDTPAEEVDLDDFGLMEVTIKYRSTSEESLSLLAFSDKWTSWGRIVDNEGTAQQYTCAEKEEIARNNGVEATLLTSTAIDRETIVNENYDRKATGKFYFRGGMPSWFFLAVSNCDNGCLASETSSSYCEGAIDIDYEVTATNSDNYRRHFGVDKRGLLEFCAVFFAFQSLLVLAAIVVRWQLLRARKYHHTVKLMVHSTILHFFAMMFCFIHWVTFARNGRGLNDLHLIGNLLQQLAEVLLIMQLLFVAKGWTVVRHKISSQGRVKIAVLGTLMIVAFLGLATWGIRVNTLDVVYVYSTPPGIAMIALRFFIVLWFCYACFTTLRAFEMKREFYIKYLAIFGLWTLLAPVMLCISFTLLPYRRFAFSYCYLKASITIAQGILLFMYNPSLWCNKLFPFHAQTSASLGIERRKGAHQGAHNRAMAAEQESVLAANSILKMDGAYMSGPNGTVLKSSAQNLASTLRMIKESGRNVAKMLLRLGVLVDDLIAALDDWEMVQDDDKDEAFDDIY